MDLRSLKMAQGFAKEIAEISDDGTIAARSTFGISLKPPGLEYDRAHILEPLPVVITPRNYILVPLLETEYTKDARGFTHPNFHRRIIDDIQEEYKLGVFGQNSIRFYDDHFQEDQLPDEVP